jgi:hypothetical protein
MEIEWMEPISQSQAPRRLMLAVQSVTQTSRSAVGSPAPAENLEDARVGTVGLTSVVKATSSNAALLRMPSVVAADSQTTSSLQSRLGMSGDSQLFQTGHGLVIGSGGSRHSLDLFTHMNNDTVLTSPSRNFEISSGAQIQLLIGVRKN